MDTEFYVFGELQITDKVTEEQVKEIIQQAKSLKKEVASLKVVRIIDVFEKVSKAWQNPDYNYRKVALELLSGSNGSSQAVVMEGIKTMCSLLSRDGMINRLNSNLGNREYLNTWTYNRDSREYIKAEPLGVVTYVSTEDNFIGGVDSLIQGLVSKNVNIMKLPMGDPLFPILFAKSLREFDDTGILHKAMVLIDWKSGTKAIENALKQESDAIVAYDGANRIVEIEKVAVRKHGTPPNGSKGISELVRWVSLDQNNLEIGWQIESLWKRYDPELDTFDFLPDEVRDAVTLARVKNIVDIVREKSPLLSKRYKDITFEDFESFRKLPLLKGSDYKKYLPPAGEGLLCGEMKGGYVFSSGGTTGRPKSVYRTVEEQHFNTVRLGKGLRISIFNENDRVANLLFAGNMWASFVSYNQALEHTGATILPIGGNHSMETIVHFLITFKANAIIAIPSLVLSLAEYVQVHNIDLKIEKMSLGGEHLFKESKEYLKKVLGVQKIASTGYTTNDTGAIGYQCEHLIGTALHHVYEDLHYVEILDVDTDEPVKIGEIGKIVVTNLQRTLMPTIRYEVGDLCRWVDMECECGRKTRVLELLGRSDDVVIIAGANLSPEVISTAIYPFENLSSHFQMIVNIENSKDNLLVVVEAKEDRFEDNAAEVKEAIFKLSNQLEFIVKNGLANDVKVNIVAPNTLQRNPKTGKISLIKDERNRS